MRFLKLLPVLLVLFVTFFFTKPTLADDNLNQELTTNQQEIDQLTAQLNQAQNQEKTLSSQLSYIDNQTKLTELKIQQTNYQIQKLNQEITDLDSRITRLSTSVDSISNVLLNRIVSTYKYGNVSMIDLLFSSNGFSDLLERLKYIQVAQANDKKVLYQLQATKTTYNDQKTDKQTRQEQQQQLDQQLQTYQTQLDGEKATKAALLKITQNNEAVYQQKLQTALPEQQAILSILDGGGNEVPDGNVNQGDVIGHVIVGPSACSSGTHLHFEVHVSGSIVDPSNYLSSGSFSYIDNDGGADEGAINPHGSWAWPLDGPIYITQGYGMTPYARATGAYGPSGHTGIDMYSPSSYAVHAVRGGALSTGGIACGGGTLHYKKVDHGDGTAAYYLHML